MTGYTLQEFYCYLKLGIRISGPVDGWGLVQQISVYPDGMTDKGCFVTKMPNAYKDGLQQSRRQLSIGLQLLGLYPMEDHQSGKYSDKYKIYTHLAVVSHCVLRGAYDEQIYYLKITNSEPLSTFRTKIYDSSQTGISSSGRSNGGYKPRTKRRVSRVDTSPINSVSRKH